MGLEHQGENQILSACALMPICKSFTVSLRYRQSVRRSGEPLVMIRPLLLALPLLAVPLFAQSPPMSHDNDMAPAGLPKNFNEPMKLFPKALGKFTRPISSKNLEAQTYFDQGFQLMYAFAKHDA